MASAINRLILGIAGAGAAVLVVGAARSFRRPRSPAENLM
jgi:hypothetical protein